MDMSWVPSGYDPETTFRIEFKIDGYLNKQNVCRKEYVKAKTVNWVVDSDRFSLYELMNDLSKEISWGSGQIPKIWVFDKNVGRDVMVSFESLLLDMFKMYEKEKKVTLLILVCDSEGSSHCSNTTPNYPCTPSQPLQDIMPGSQIQLGSSQGYDDFNEQVGLDVEELYSDDEKGAGHEENVVEEEHVDNLTGELSVGVVAQFEPFIAYDPENPTIELNALFPDVDAFRKAIRHFAIKEFEIRTVKSDKKRFIGKCKHKGCPWRIYASKVRDSAVQDYSLT